MPQLPNTYGRRQIATPQRRVQGYSTQAYEQANLQAARNLERAGQEMSAYGEQRYDDAAKDAITNAQARENYAKRQMMDVLYGTDDKEGLYSKKGANALNVEHDFDEQWKTIKGAAMNGVEHPEARKALETSLENMYMSNLDNVKRYRMTERRGYFSDLSATRSALAQEQAGLEWNNQDSFKSALADAEKSALNAAKMQGLPQEAQGLAVREARSGTYLTRITAMINTDNPAVMAQAAMLYDNARQKGELTFDAVTRIDKMIDSVLPKVNAMSAFDKFRNSMDIKEQGTDMIHDAMLTVESGRRHTVDKDGAEQIITSKAGALGIAQLMPATAAEMEKELGLPAGSHVIEEYNIQIGKAYLDKMAKKFGDNTLAVLAYNWGPGSVEEHMKKVGDPRTGEITMDYFLATIDNDEARQYVPKVMAAMGGPMDKLDLNRANIMAADMPEDESKEFIKLVEKQNMAIQAQEDQARATLLDDAMAFITSNSSGTESMPTSMLARANSLGMYRELSEYDGKTDANTAEFLYGLAPKDLKELDLNTPGIRLKLSPDDYQAWVKKQKALDDPAKMVTAERRNRMVNDAFAKEGLSTRTDEGIARKNRLNELVDLEINAFAEQHSGRYPNMAEMQGIIDELIIKGKYDTSPGTAWNPLNWGGSKDYAFDMELDDIPKKQRQKIKEALQARGMPLTEANIIRTFLMAQQVPKE